MSSKTFKSISGNTSLTIEPHDSGVNFYITDLRGNYVAVVTPAEYAAGEALAVLEAAVVGESSDAGVAAGYLRSYIAEQERTTAKAEELAELEAEALELYKAHTGYTHAKSLSDAAAPERWLAVARRAREMRAEK